MHNHHFFLRQLSEKLNAVLQNYLLVSCFSQNKDELIFEFNNSKDSYLIKVNLHPEFCCLSFPYSFKRARKNSIDLFSPAILKKVVHFQSFGNERAFAIQLEKSLTLLFKMFGNQANIILFEDGSVNEIFRKNFKNDRELKLESFREAAAGSAFPDSTKFHIGQFFIIESEGRIQFSLIPKDEIIAQFTDPVKAVTEFFNLKVSTDALQKAKQKALKIITEKEKRTQLYLEKVQLELQALKHDNHYQAWADLIIANLHNISKGADSVTLKDFSGDHSYVIKLKKDLSPQQNASAFYRKAKNKTIEVAQITATLFDKRKLLETIHLAKEKIENSTDSEGIKQLMQSIGLFAKQKPISERLPYRTVVFMGYTIMIGKNANDNDELTLRHTYKEDLWLHAKDVSGSHVVVKHQAGKNFPKDVIERAAQLAAFYSKRKGESLCPVSYTSKKFVRKRKGDPPGMMVVEKEKVILIEPKT